MIDQHRAVAVDPVKRDEAVRADRLPGGLAAEQPVHGLTVAPRFLLVPLRYALVHVPREDVAHAGLAGFVAPVTGGNAAVDGAAHPLDHGQRVGVHDVACGLAHDHEHGARSDRLGRGRGHVSVDVADGDRDAFGQAGPLRGLSGQAAGPRTKREDRVLELVLGEGRKTAG